MNPDTVPALIAEEPAASAPPRITARLFADRTAVLVVGLCAGFAVGLCFAPHAAEPAPAALHAIAVKDAPSPATASGSAPAAPMVPASRTIDPRVVARVRRSGTIRVGVFGDSFGVGVWDALYRMLPERDGYRVLRFAQEATGFTRYRVDDLEARARAQLAGGPVDVAVVSLGVNDAQPMWEGRLYPFMSDDWQRIVGDRVDRFVATLRAGGARVYWIGLPAMRDPALDAKVQALNALFRAHMARLGVTFVGTRALSVGPDGLYASHLPGPAGQPRLMRTGDGVHMIGIGYQRIAGPAVQDIGSYAARVRLAAHGAGATRP